MSTSLSPTFLANLSQVYAALRPQALSAVFRADLAKVHATVQPQALSTAFLSDLALVHASLPVASDANLQFLANRFHDWRKVTQEFVRNHLKDLNDDDPLRCPISLFRTMDYGRLETAHTRTLAWLLDPKKNAEHGFGDALLAALLVQLAELDHFDCLYVEQVASEHPVEASVGSGRLDLIAKGEWEKAGNRVRWVLVIEAKVDAWEGEGQLNKYDDWLRANSEGRETYRVFLTPDGRVPDDECDEWRPMSFLRLVQIFGKVYRKLRTASGFHFLRFYLAGVLQDICGWPGHISAEAPDPYSVASYLKTVYDSTSEGAIHDAAR